MKRLLVGLSLGLCALLSACTGSKVPAPADPAPSPSMSYSTTQGWPQMTGVQFDQALRSGNVEQHNGGGFPEFGTLLASTQTGGPQSMQIDLSKVHGKIIGIYACASSKGAPHVKVLSGTKSLLGFWSDTCEDTSIYAGTSPPIGTVGQATVTVTVPVKVKYAFVLEEVK